jgi:Rrf2 family protein
MLALSQTTGYAILALSCLDGCQHRWVLARDISECANIPLPYLSKLLHALTGSELVLAKRGYRGGFQLGRPAEKITLLQVAEAVEGRKWLPQCLLGLDECSDHRACPTHEFWKKQRTRIEKQLKQLTLRDVAAFEKRRGTRLVGCGCDTRPDPP